MRLAVISDIHGNLRALEAVLADIKGRAVDATVNLGDLAAGPLWPRETVELLDTLGLPTVRGNHDRWMGDRPLDKLPPLQPNQLFELTLEPPTGSPIGKPTGPIQFIGRAVKVL